MVKEWKVLDVTSSVNVEIVINKLAMDGWEVEHATSGYAFSTIFENQLDRHVELGKVFLSREISPSNYQQKVDGYADDYVVNYAKKVELYERLAKETRYDVVMKDVLNLLENIKRTLEGGKMDKSIIPSDKKDIVPSDKKKDKKS